MRMLTIQVPENIGAILDEKAKMCDLSVKNYVLYSIEKDVGEKSSSNELPDKI